MPNIAIVQIQTTLNNGMEEEAGGNLYTDIYDAAGKLVSKGYASLNGNPGVAGW